MAIKERKQITGTTAQINAYEGHEGQIVWDKEKKTLVGMSGTAGTNYPLAQQAYVDEGLEGKEDKGTCLPKSEGTLLGGCVSLQSPDGLGTTQILRSNPGSEYAGVDIPSESSNWDNGAILSLRTNDAVEEAGEFLIRTGRSPYVFFFRGTPDGSLTWRDRELVRVGDASIQQPFTIGSSGASYTAPFTGRCYVAGSAQGEGGFVELINDKTLDHDSAYTVPGKGWMRAQVFVRKGDTVTIHYGNWAMNEAYWVD